MKKLLVTTVLMLLFSALTFAQQLTQTIRGSILDNDNKMPLIGATVMIVGSDPVIGAAADINGEFRLENIPIGRHSLQISYIGYQPKTIPGIEVNSGKEVFLDINLQESAVKLEEVVIKASRDKGEALNDMALVSARSISVEETKRYAGGFDDPSRVVSNYAGVNSSPDGSADIIVRGNSPKYMQWNLEGLEISNPYHFNTSFGGLSIFNNNLLSASDFYTGAFSPEYGNVLSGVYNVQLRPGNNEQFESTFGFGLLGTDFTVEGPFKKGYGGSYLANYRYSTTAFMTELGLIDVGGTPKYQDGTFKVVLPTKNTGTFSIFGIGGLSGFTFEDIEPDLWITPGNETVAADINEDYDKSSYQLHGGVNHILPLTNNSFLSSSISFSGSGSKDEVFEAKTLSIFNDQGEFLYDSIVNRRLNFKSDVSKTTFRGAVSYSLKISAKHKIKVGTKYDLFNYSYTQSFLKTDETGMVTAVDFNEYVGTIRNFISWKYRLNDNITFISGLHNMNVLLNNKSTLEPRLAVNWKLNPGNSLHAGYGNHSTMESIHHYFTKVESADGNINEPNKELDLLKAHHFVLGYEKRFNKNLLATIELYYQDLYNLPVENVDTSYFATINENFDFRYVDLVNEGTGKNFGLELTLERFFDNNIFFLINGSIYNSTYKSLENVERNTRFNNNYLVNLLAGKEFHKLGKKENQVLAVNTKIFFRGGQTYIPLLRDDQGNLNVDPANQKYWDYSKAYDDKFEAMYQINLSASYKFNRPKATHEIFVDLQNITNSIANISEYYDESEPGSVGYRSQFGFFPNLMYRVYF